ncbi:DUF928 domain-containing protein [Chroococcidiopsis sp. TS-821]|uniref:DUF928 domain-containing protein n=1 Tax=Chroococcidiopsis sp. TS-821 TaxID=1378066 RepID=UPI000CEE2B02|nr:DUF928 domain-containing protein [Chroococcidiopsis sp. TS-821]PPS45409.1 hypothetical protein B1A85_03920 [Chroococcidiopsis sp. TS-821]
MVVVRFCQFALLGCLVLGLLPAKVHSLPQTNAKEVLATATRLNFVPPPPPADIGIPGDRTGAGRRGCIANSSAIPDKQLTAIVPIAKAATGVDVVWGMTTAEHPTFWFYVPYRAQDVHAAKFVLRAADNRIAYQTAVPLPNQPGVISLTLPKTAAPLEIAKQYHWYFNIYCAERKPPTAIVHGGVQRRAIAPTLASQLEQATPQKRAELYFANGFWYDAVTVLGELYYRNPGNIELAQDWAKVLRFVGLEAIASEPIASCCHLMQQVRREL